MKAVCTACKNMVDLPDIDMPKIVNLPGVSFIVVEHSSQTPCAVCGAVLVHGISNVGAVGIVGLPIAPADQKSVILSPNGLHMVKN